MPRIARSSPVRAAHPVPEPLEPRLLFSLVPKLPLLPLPAAHAPVVAASILPHFSTAVGVPITEPLSHTSSGNLPLPSELTAPGKALTASIDWGDGTITRATLVRDSSGMVVAYGADHVYAAPGIFSGVLIYYTETVDPAVGIPASPGPDAVRYGFNYLYFDVVDVQPTTALLSALAGSPMTAVVANIPRVHGFPAPSTPTQVLINPTTLNRLVASIAWGDGASSPALFATNPAGGYDLIGTHAFRRGGTLPVDITVQQLFPVSEGHDSIASESHYATTARVIARASAFGKLPILPR